MNSRVAKAIRKKIFGDMATRGKTYTTDQRGAVHVKDLFRNYKDAKRKYKLWKYQGMRDRVSRAVENL